LLCLHHIQKRKGYKIIAKLFGVSEKYVQILLNKYAKDGIDGILPKIRKPREDKITNSFDVLDLPLPAVSPELNPVEQVWAYSRCHYLSNRVFKDIDGIEISCCES
jgi:transposase